MNKMFEDLRGYLDTDWRTKENILGMLNRLGYKDIDERTLRNKIKEHNLEYIKGNSEVFIAHNNSCKPFGYKMTTDPEEIKKSIMDNQSRAIDQLTFVSGVKKRLSERNQLTLTPNETKLFDVIAVMTA